MHHGLGVPYVLVDVHNMNIPSTQEHMQVYVCVFHAHNSIILSMIRYDALNKHFQIMRLKISPVILQCQFSTKFVSVHHNG